MADNIKYRFIQNVGDYFPSGYFSEDFINKIQKTAGLSSDEMSELCKPYVRLRGVYESYKNYILNTNPRVKDVIRHTHDFHTELLKILGYETSNPYSQFVSINDDDHSVVPIRHILTKNGRPTMFVMEMQPLIKTGDQEPQGLFEQQYNTVQDGQHVTEIIKHQRYYAGQWSEVFKLPDDGETHISPAVINKAIDAIFLLPEERRPHFILMLAGNTLFLLDSDKWNRNSYLQFSLDELFSQASIRAFRNYYALFHLLVCKETLSPISDSVLMDKIIDDSYRNAYEVTKDLKEGVILTVETLANEALWYWQHEQNNPDSTLKDNPIDKIDYTDDDFETAVRDDCITIAYRLLFIFFAESRDELGILPINDDVYREGYSLEMLRDLEKVPLISDESRNGYFFHESLSDIFYMLSHGFRMDQQNNKSFSVMRIDSPLFDDKRLHYLGNVKIRNIEWQKIIRALSLSNSDKQVGRISYANLGINQLGSVYESLLAYRGFYAEQDYIEVYKAGKKDEGTYLVPYSRMEVFDENTEVLKDKDGEVEILKKGTFVYRLNGRDRQKSASYYTPEQLTKSTVKYTLKKILEDVASGKKSALELLDMKFLEPAMGAAAFQNEYINQISYAYLKYRQEELRKEGKHNWRIQPEYWNEELQKVKAYIATHNVYGVDLNPTAIELGKLSLWLNVLHRDMGTPFFSNRLVVGNAVIGAWLKVYKKEDVVGKTGRNSRLLPNAWWEKVPQKLHFHKNSVARSVNEIYHFLLPDKGMLAVQSLKEVYVPANATEEERVKAKKRRKQLIKGMKDKIKEWTAPINGDEFKMLQRLSAKIDKLLSEYEVFQLSIERYTNNKTQLFGVYGQTELLDNVSDYAEKERLNDTRYRHNSAYFRLKMVMDYWCALWYWDFDHADQLPSRTDYWNDLDSMLNVSDEEIDKRTKRALKNYVDSKGQIGLFPEGHSSDIFFKQQLDAFAGEEGNEDVEEEVSKVISKAQLDTLADQKGEYRTFFDDSPRFQYVKELSDRYHFFHPMLEFIEVFWLRDGFDIICGNPPWVKQEFDEAGLISDKYPEFVIRNASSTSIKAFENKIFEQDAELCNSYISEEKDVICTIAFLNAFSNYPFLDGQKNNLYKCILENSFSFISNSGFVGFLHPDGVYDDPHGQSLRVQIYHRLRYHFQYQNELTLFAEVDHHTKYSENVYGPYQQEVHFASISNLFTPTTVDPCFTHDGHGICGGIKDENGKWNISSHKDRIVWYGRKELEVLAGAFEGNPNNWESTKLVSIHSVEIMDVLSKFANTSTHVSDFQFIIGDGLRENTAVEKGIMKRNTCYPDMEKCELICNGPHFFVLNPLYKNPREKCKINSDYDPIDLRSIDTDYIPRTNYVPTISLTKYENLVKGFQVGVDEKGNPIFDNWIDYYKLAFSAMVGTASERTLAGSIIPPKVSHVHAVISIAFKELPKLIEFSGLCASVPYDFFIKTIGSSSIIPSRLITLPLKFEDDYKNSLFVRTLQLNCLTKYYADLWLELWSPKYKDEQWSIDDSRLKPFNTLTEQWQWSTPLRNYFERRQALVEIDVISAMALGLSLKDLEMIYTIQFPVLQQNEADTWYDSKGNIVFTCSKGLTGVGCDRKEWENIRGNVSPDDLTYDGKGKEYVHTIDPKKSELYGGQKVTYYPPYTRCDRITDYRRAWAYFEKKFQ